MTTIPLKEWQVYFTLFLYSIVLLSVGALSLRMIANSHFKRVFRLIRILDGKFRQKEILLNLKEQELRSIINSVDKGYQVTRLQKIIALFPKIWETMKEIEENIGQCGKPLHHGYAKEAYRFYLALDKILISIEETVKAGYNEVSNLRK